MPDFVLTFNGEPVGRVTLASWEFVDSISGAMLDGQRLELSGGFVKHPDKQPTLVELVLSPLAIPEPPEVK